MRWESDRLVTRVTGVQKILGCVAVGGCCGFTESTKVEDSLREKINKVCSAGGAASVPLLFSLCSTSTPCMLAPLLWSPRARWQRCLDLAALNAISMSSSVTY
jgi:hypothetical protein